MTAEEIIRSIAHRWEANATRTQELNNISTERKLVKTNRRIYSSDLAKFEKRRTTLSVPSPLVDFRARQGGVNQSESIKHALLLELRNDKQLERERAENPFNADRQLATILRDSRVFSLDISETDNKLIITTQPVETTYLDRENNTQTLNMGIFVMTFTPSNRLPSVVNMTYGFLMPFAHPCIKYGTICRGDYDEPLREYMASLNFDLFVDTLMLFLYDLNSDYAHTNINNLVSRIEEGIQGREEFNTADRTITGFVGGATST